MSVIEKIRAEIERLTDELELQARENAEANNGEATDYCFGVVDMQMNLLSFLDTLEEPVCHYGDVPSYERCVVCSAACSARVEEKSEIPTNLDELLDDYFEKLVVPEHQIIFEDTYRKIATDFYRMGQGSSEKPNTPEGLDEAANAYSNEHNDDCFDAIGSVCPHIIEAFKAGAEWAMNQFEPATFGNTLGDTELFKKK